jgi:hypothetical protein
MYVKLNDADAQSLAGRLIWSGVRFSVSYDFSPGTELPSETNRDVVIFVDPSSKIKVFRKHAESFGEVVREDWRENR